MKGNRAYCRVCGRWVHEGDGHTAPMPDFGDNVAARQNWGWAQKAMEPAKAGWRVTCAVCWDAREHRQECAVALLAILGVAESEEVAQSVMQSQVKWDLDRNRFWGGPTAEAHDSATGTAWGHLSPEERAALMAAYGEVVARDLPQTSTMGACGMCGRATQVGAWWEGPSALRWPDESPTALCGVCHAAWEMRGSPDTIADIRGVGVEVASGIPIPLGVSAPPDMRLFAESRTADKAGLPEPWTYSSALTEYIESRWTNQPDRAPEHRQAEFFARHDQARRQEEQARQARREEVNARAW